MNETKFAPISHKHEALLKKALKRPGFREAYEGLESEYTLARELLTARTRAGLTQEAVASRMHTTKSAVSRLESVGEGKHSPSLTSLKKYAAAVGCSIRITLIPVKERQTKRI